MFGAYPFGTPYFGDGPGAETPPVPPLARGGGGWVRHREKLPPRHHLRHEEEWNRREQAEELEIVSLLMEWLSRN